MKKENERRYQKTKMHLFRSLRDEGDFGAIIPQ